MLFSMLLGKRGGVNILNVATTGDFRTPVAASSVFSARDDTIRLEVACLKQADMLPLSEGAQFR